VPVAVLGHVFPIQGPYSFGGPDARFGAKRDGHTHQGQDLVAAAGLPVVTPRGGTVKAIGYQAGGAGHYVVVDSDRDYVFMHLEAGSIPGEEGDAVGTGQRIGRVGSTGRSSGAHLHFEIWDGKGWYTGGKPVDPLPFLQAWAR
jgi:murein DD-endopeptidase MepM/ murein hydrolase activator NlpD